jgi:hypothetical protein
MIDHEAILRKAAKEIRAANINGWGNACEGGADHIAALEARCRELEAQIAEGQQVVMSLAPGSTHWDGCEAHHRVCAWLKATAGKPD